MEAPEWSSEWQRKEKKRCGAMTRKGTPCMRRELFKNGKCRNHGGLSLNGKEKASITALTGRIFAKTGPSTPEGRARSFAARDAGRNRYFRLRKNGRQENHT